MRVWFLCIKLMRYLLIIIMNRMFICNCLSSTYTHTYIYIYVSHFKYLYRKIALWTNGIWYFTRLYFSSLMSSGFKLGQILEASTVWLLFFSFFTKLQYSAITVEAVFDKISTKHNNSTVILDVTKHTSFTISTKSRACPLSVLRGSCGILVSSIRAPSCLHRKLIHALLLIPRVRFHTVRRSLRSQAMVIPTFQSV